ncbi:Protein of unknown function [Escherichia coli D6-113.11]|nr:Protein of unknown function [Escherichia coli D6-113.11]CDU33763.1 Protein of unknown function [Escherichia coli D6-113.11]
MPEHASGSLHKNKHNTHPE